MNRLMWLVRLAAVCAAATVSASAAHADDHESIRLALADGRPGAALASCEARGMATMDRDLRFLCGQAALRVGDQLQQAGLTTLARERWQQAITFDPQLTDDPTFLQRLIDTAPNRTPPADPPAPTPSGNKIVLDEAPTPIKVVKPPATGRRTATAEALARGDLKVPPPSKPTTPPPPPGPRAGRHFSLSLGAGYTDGLVGFAVGWLSGEQLWMEVATGLVFPTVDIRMRFLVLKEELTPFIGFGLIVPFGSKDRLGLELSGVEAIYELADAFHLDVGATWSPTPGLEILAGVSFVTPFDSTHPDTVVFFPQFIGAVAWIF